MAPAVVPAESVNVANLVVPSCPPRLAFTREDFLSPNFSVDGFLSRKTASVGLEQLRDDLTDYQKILQSAMIELINQDYADFVNLSSNLVGLDDRIEVIEEPLKQFHGEALHVQNSLTEALAALRCKLAEREALQAKRISLQNLEHVVNTLNKIERLLNVAEPDAKLSGDLVERVATDINYLNFCLSKCAAPAFVDEIRPRIEIVGSRLQSSLESHLLDAIDQENKDSLKRCLRIFATIDKVSDAQSLVRKEIISPYLDDVITKENLDEDPQGLKGLLMRVNKIIPAKLELLIQLTNSGVLKEFDFLVQSLWVDIVEKIEENLLTIFSAGDPEKFHFSYLTTLNWLEEFETRLSDSTAVEKFRSNRAYTSFMGRWDLSLYSYFQIRFQEIAMPVEIAVENIMFEKSKIHHGKFHLLASEVILTSIRHCWDPSIFLPALTHRFWKLTLQIISRYSTAASKAVTVKCKEPTVRALEESKMKPSPTTVTLVPGGNTRSSHSRSASDQGLSQSTEDSTPVITEDEIVHGLVCLYLDITSLAEEKSSILNEIVIPSLPSSVADKFDLFETSLTESFDILSGNKNVIVQRLVDIITSRCSGFLKQVSDIPRLYRRTNRDLPSKPCTYMTSLLAPLRNFHSVYSSIVDQDNVINAWLVLILNNIVDQYFHNVSDVLAAVQKMEESLQRLKKVRGLAPANTGVNDSRAGGMSDDDKIRLQLFVDVQHLLSNMQTMGVSQEQIPSSLEVEKLVKEATKSFYDDYLSKISANN